MSAKRLRLKGQGFCVCFWWEKSLGLYPQCACLQKLPFPTRFHVANVGLLCQASSNPGCPHHTSPVFHCSIYRLPFHMHFVHHSQQSGCVAMLHEWWPMQRLGCKHPKITLPAATRSSICCTNRAAFARKIWTVTSAALLAWWSDTGTASSCTTYLPPLCGVGMPAIMFVALSCTQRHVSLSFSPSSRLQKQKSIDSTECPEDSWVLGLCGSCFARYCTQRGHQAWNSSWVRPWFSTSCCEGSSGFDYTTGARSSSLRILISPPCAASKVWALTCSTIRFKHLLLPPLSKWTATCPQNFQRAVCWHQNAIDQNCLWIFWKWHNTIFFQGLCCLKVCRCLVWHFIRGYACRVASIAPSFSLGSQDLQLNGRTWRNPNAHPALHACVQV